MAEAALAGVTVADLTTGVDGPFATKLLADLGARVVKVEPPDGDPCRSFGPFPGDVPDRELGGLFLYLNRGKESVTADLATARGKTIVQRLAAVSDLLVENERPGTMESFGLDYTALAPSNPRLVYTSVTGFGGDGPRAGWKAPDIVRQAVSGWMWQGGDPGRPPLRSGGSLSYYLTGAAAAAASLVGLAHQRRTGEGQHVDVSAMEAFVTCTGQEIHRVSCGGPEQTHRRSGHHYLPFAILRSRDGWVGINVLTQGNWEAFCEWAGMTDLLVDPRFARIEEIRRPERGAEIHERVQAWVSSQPRDLLIEEGQRRRIAVAMVPTMDEVLSLPQHRERQFIETVTHRGVTYRQPGFPYRLSLTPAGTNDHRGGD